MKIDLEIPYPVPDNTLVTFEDNNTTWVLLTGIATASGTWEWDSGDLRMVHEEKLLQLCTVQIGTIYLPNRNPVRPGKSMWFTWGALRGTERPTAPTPLFPHETLEQTRIREQIWSDLLEQGYRKQKLLDAYLEKLG